MVRKFALACRTQALVALARRDPMQAIRWGERAIELAQQCGDEDVTGMTESAIGSAQMILDYELGRAYLDRCLRRAIQDGRAMHAANAFAHLGRRSAELYAVAGSACHLRADLSDAQESAEILIRAIQNIAPNALGDRVSHRSIYLALPASGMAVDTASVAVPRFGPAATHLSSKWLLASQDGDGCVRVPLFPFPVARLLRWRFMRLCKTRTAIRAILARSCSDERWAGTEPILGDIPRCSRRRMV